MNRDTADTVSSVSTVSLLTPWEEIGPRVTNGPFRPSVQWTILTGGSNWRCNDAQVIVNVGIIATSESPPDWARFPPGTLMGSPDMDLGYYSLTNCQCEWMLGWILLSLQVSCIGGGTASSITNCANKIRVPPKSGDPFSIPGSHTLAADNGQSSHWAENNCSNDRAQETKSNKHSVKTLNWNALADLKGWRYLKYL